MKSSDEMIASLMDRRDRYVIAQKLKRKTIIRTLLAVLVIFLALSGTTLIGIMRRNQKEEPENSHSGSEKDTLQDITAVQPVPAGHNHTLVIDGREFYITEISESLPEGYIFLRELTDKEALGTVPAGCRLYVSMGISSDVDCQEFWLYQTRDTVNAISYQGMMYYSTVEEIATQSKESLEGIYTHWKVKP